jgi:hypothetical protein
LAISKKGLCYQPLRTAFVLPAYFHLLKSGWCFAWRVTLFRNNAAVLPILERLPRNPVARRSPDTQKAVGRFLTRRKGSKITVKLLKKPL